MPVAPRTPVLVGVGQVTSRPDPDLAAADRPQPLDLMVRALQAAAEDCDGVAPGSVAPAGRALLERAQSLQVIASSAWHTANPAQLVAERLEISPSELVLGSGGGTTPLAVLHHAAGQIAEGVLEVVAVTGAEASYTRNLAQRTVDLGALHWASQPADTTAAPRLFGASDRPPTTPLEAARGLTGRLEAYALYEQALRTARGLDLDAHRAAMGARWAEAALVAETNPYAWQREPRTAAELVEITAANRRTCTPYTKLLTANTSVDQGAAFLLTSYEAACRAGVDPERLVFPLAGAEVQEHWFCSHRADLSHLPALEIAGKAVFAAAEVLAEECSVIDLYAAAPVAVELAAQALGLDLADAERGWTTTGGLSFAGAPGANSVSHSLAGVVQALRSRPGACGVLNAMGGHLQKHAVTVLGARPPRHRGERPFQKVEVQDLADALPQSRVDAAYVGPVTIETFAITCDRFGDPASGVFALRTPEGARTWGRGSDPVSVGALLEVDCCGRAGTLDAEGIVTVS